MNEINREAFEERAAILEFDGGLSRAEAERRALATHPGAVAEKAGRTANAIEAAELRELVRATYPGEADQEEALAAALADPDAALLCYRTIAKARGLTIGLWSTAAKSCKSCVHAARLGIGNLYCGGRDDLPRAYGDNHPLRRPPDDGGSTCDTWIDA